ncbi:hypothetical protein TanjilG_07681 [Lupinus angustifolius]|uniref:UDP-glycosyltransferases domain-containing protein n=1 Tax=Lupinus angustifolius TaxID=3871 RepID=A0A1J7H091_LUPAN|nr:hypothetical protein TanjilG_07681 [Lupinus angustifolius]
MSEENTLEVLILSLPFQGHLNPMLNLGKHLISKGVHVTFAVTEDGRHHMKQNLHNSKIQFEFFSNGLSLDFDRSNIDVLINSLNVKGSKNFSTLLTTLTKVHNYSCVIINPFVPFAIDVIADHGIPCAMLWIQASAVYSIYYRYYKNIDYFPNLEDPNEKVNLPSLPVFDVRDLPSFILPSSPRYYTVYMNDLFKALDKVKWVLDLPLEFLEETKGRGLVVKWSPQEKVLMHPGVACFVSHCGWNSMIETLITGVSVICYPEWSDQRTNAKLIENVFQNGVNLKCDEDRVASTEEIERCIREVMEGPSALKIKKRAIEIKESARKSLQEGGTSHQNLDKFVNDLTETNTVKA